MIKRSFQKALSLAMLVLLLSPLAALAQRIDLGAPLKLDPNVRHGVLPNGMKYYLQRNTEPANRVELRLAVNAGSILEDDDQQGLAHFTEHMAFNGSTHFKKNELVNYLESIGTKFGAHLNAYTSFDETVYMLQVPTDNPEILAKALLVLEDWAHGVSFDNEEIDKERGVVIEEWRLGRGADERMMQRYFPVLFKDSRYAERLPIGKKEILESFKYETIKRFYQKWYRPDLMAVCLVGDIDVDKMEATIKTQFGAIPKPATPVTRPNHPVPSHKEVLVAVEQDKEATMTIMQVMHMAPQWPKATVGDYRQMLVRDLAADMLSSRLTELKTAGKAPFLFAGANAGDFIRGSSSFGGFGLMEPTQVKKGVEVMVTEMERARRFGFLPTELERSKKTMLSQKESDFRDKDNMESNRIVMEYVYNFLEGNPALGPEQEFEHAKQLLPTITIEEVNASIAAMITQENVKIILTGPLKEGIVFPTKEEVLELVSTIRSAAMEPWKDITDDRPLVSKEPAAGKVVSEKQAPQGITEWTLSNGVRVIVKPTDFKSEEILFTAWSPGGSSRASDKDYWAADNCGQIISGAGAGVFSKATLDKKFADKKMELSPWVDDIYEGFDGSTRPEDLETLLQMVYLYHTAPRQDKEAFSSFQNDMKSFMAFSAGPEGAWRDSITSIMACGHPRKQPLTEARINSISQQNAFMFYLDRFGDASDFTYMFVGNVDLATFKPMVEKWLGGLPGNARKETWKDIGIKTPEGVVKRDIYAGSEPKSMVNLTFHGPATYSEETSFKLNAVVKVLNIMLRESMREEKGGVYGVRVSPEMKKLPQAGYKLTIQFGCAPENVEDLIATALNDIRNLQQNGPSEINLGKVRETLRREHETDIQDNMFWYRTLRRLYQNGDSPEAVTTYDKWVESLTAKDVQETAKALLNMDRYVRVVLWPEKN
jgi:zinc protease